MTKGVGEISLPFFEKELSDIYNNQVRIVNFAENINESLIILCIKWKNDKIKNVVNIRHIIFEEQSDLGNSMSF
jgi:hypothetical protein